jgi:hypothetical protein
LLFYIAKIYEKMSGERDIYREKRILLPFPEFIVLYNGKAPYPEGKEMKLSESFRDPGELGLGKGGIVSLELRVKVYNINGGTTRVLWGDAKGWRGTVSLWRR